MEEDINICLVDDDKLNRRTNDRIFEQSEKFVDWFILF